MITYEIHNQDCLLGLPRIPDGSIDLVIADPPYGLGKDYGNDSDTLSPGRLLDWTCNWIVALLPKIKETGSLYIFTSWQYSPEIFSFLKGHMTMRNEIIWDRRVPSMGGSTRKFSSVHDNIGFFVKSKNDYYFSIDSVRQPYDKETKKARSRSIFLGKKWLEVGHNPKDIWSISRLHRIHSERWDHPTQKPFELIERMVLASSPAGGMVLDPFAGTGTTLDAAFSNGRNSIGFEINPDYCRIIERRMTRHKMLGQFI